MMFVTEIERKEDGLWFVKEEVCAYQTEDPSWLIGQAKRWALRRDERICVRKIEDDADWNKEDYPDYVNVFVKEG